MQTVFEHILSSGGLSEIQPGAGAPEGTFFANFKVLSEPGYLKVADVNLAKKNGVEESFDEARDETKDETRG